MTPTRAPTQTPTRTPTSDCRLATVSELSNNGLEGFDDFVAVDAGFGESELEPERLRGGLVAEDVSFWAAGFGFGGLFADGFARDAAISRYFFDQSDHFLGVALPNYL